MSQYKVKRDGVTIPKRTGTRTSTRTKEVFYRNTHTVYNEGDVISESDIAPEFLESDGADKVLEKVESKSSGQKTSKKSKS